MANVVYALILAVLFVMVIIAAVRVFGRKSHKLDDSWAAAEDLFDYRQSFNIAGINKHNLAPADCGTWKGFVVCEPDNPYDPNAVAVVKGADRVIGYLSKEIAKEHHEAIAAEEGQLPCLIHIERKFDEDEVRHYFVGRVQILWPGTE